MRPVIRLFFRTLRLVLAPILHLIDRITTPRGVERSPEEQQRVDEQTAAFTLYQFRSCPFCIKTRRAIKRLSLNIELRDALHDPQARAELQQGGGEIKVPCLRVDEGNGKVQWMYESSEIIAYLNRRFAPASDGDREVGLSG